jgi:hypothetical protein
MEKYFIKKSNKQNGSANDSNYEDGSTRTIFYIQKQSKDQRKEKREKENDLLISFITKLEAKLDNIPNIILTKMLEQKVKTKTFVQNSNDASTTINGSSFSFLNENSSSKLMFL